MNRFASILFFILGLALMTSMAGMELAAILTFGFSLYLFSRKELPSLQGSKLKAPLALGLGLAVVSLTSLVANGATNDILTPAAWFIRWILFWFCIAILFRRFPNSHRHLVSGLYLGLFLAFINGLLQYFTGYDFVRGSEIEYFANVAKDTVRVRSFFNIPTTWGYILSLFLLIPVHEFLKSTERRHRILHGVIFFMGTTTLFFTYTRGAWLAFIGGLFVYLAFENRRLIMPTFIGLAIIIAAGTGFNRSFQERASTVGSSKYYSNLQRLELWKAHSQIFLDNPWLGVGFNQNDWVVAEYHEAMGHVEKHRSHAHNSYLQYLAGTGVFGFLFFALTLLALISLAAGLGPLSGLDTQFNALGLSIGLIFAAGLLVDCNFGDSEVRYSFLTYMALMAALAKKPSLKVKSMSTNPNH